MDYRIVRKGGDILLILQIDEKRVEETAPLVADFRVELNSYKGIKVQPDIQEGKEDLLYFLKSQYPVFIAKEDEKVVGYLVCRIEDEVLWVEHLFVSHDYRRRGIASLLFQKAEEIAQSMGQETVFNYVHPNNDRMIEFLRSKGYTVLNLIEIRKPYKEEKIGTTIKVDKHTFDY